MSEQHEVTPKTYYVIFGTLMALTALTVLAAQLRLGVMKVPVGLGIAVVKAVLVVLFFMHLLHSTRLTWVVALGALVFLSILFALTLSDYLARPGWGTVGN